MSLDIEVGALSGRRRATSLVIFCQAQFKSSSSSVQLGTETGLIITVRPTPPTHPPTHPTPDKYIASTQEA